MMRALWPTSTEDDFGDERVFVWARNEGGLGGFISFALRPWAEGCELRPVPYVEGGGWRRTCVAAASGAP